MVRREKEDGPARHRQSSPLVARQAGRLGDGRRPSRHNHSH